MGPHNGVPATHSASQTRVNALLLPRGAPRGDDPDGQNARWVRFAKMRRPSERNPSASASTAQVRCGASRSMRACPSSSFETRARRARIRGISSACALLRMRTTEVTARHPTVFGNSHLTMSNSHSRSRGAVLRPGLLTFASLTRIEGWAERRSATRGSSRRLRLPQFLQRLIFLRLRRPHAASSILRVHGSEPG